MKDVMFATAIANMPGLLTQDKSYLVQHENKGYITIVDDRGVQCVYSAARFTITLTPKGSPDFSENAYNRDGEKITCPVVEEYEARKAATHNFLIERCEARRDSAIEDSDANLAALLFDVLTVLKRGAQ